MQLRSGKTIISNKVFDNKENIRPCPTRSAVVVGQDTCIGVVGLTDVTPTTQDHSKWFREYCVKMINQLNQNKVDFTEDVMSAHDFIVMEQLRIIDELFFTISIYIPVVNIKPKVYTALFERSVELEKLIKKMVFRSFWKKEDEWSVEDVRYAKGVIDTIKYAQEKLTQYME
jgi:hypothetical protein